MPTHLSEKPGGQNYNRNCKTQNDLNPLVNRNRQDYLAYALGKLIWLKVLYTIEHIG